MEGVLWDPEEVELHLRIPSVFSLESFMWIQRKKYTLQVHTQLYKFREIHTDLFQELPSDPIKEI